MIPHVDMIFDRTSIMSQILSRKINPYTREKVPDENILNKFNLSPDVICKVEEFHMKLKSMEGLFIFTQIFLLIDFLKKFYQNQIHQ